MPSSLAVIHPSTLGCSPRPPVSVGGTGAARLELPGIFSGACLGALSACPGARGTFRSQGSLPYGVKPGIPSPGGPYAPPSPLRSARRGRNVDRLSIGVPVRVSLRPRLTLIRLALIRKPWPCGGRASHPPCRYSCLHLPFRPLHRPSRDRFGAAGMLPYRTSARSFGGRLDARSFSTRSRSTSELLRTL